MTIANCAAPGRHGLGCSCAYVGCARKCVAGWIPVGVSPIVCPEHPWPTVPSWAARIAHEAVEVWGALQKPAELAAFLHIAHGAVHAPSAAGVVVEIGSDAGGTLYAWRQLGTGVDVLAVSLPGGAYGTGRMISTHGARVIHGDSHEPATLDELRRILAGRPVDVLFIDGDHTLDGCARDVEMYGPLVRDGGVLALHDICHHPEHPDVEVERVWHMVTRSGAVTLAVELVTEPAVWGGIGYVQLGAPRPVRHAGLRRSLDKAEPPRATNSEGFTAPHRTLPGDEMAADA